MDQSVSAAKVLKLPFEQLPNLPKPVIPELNLEIDNIQLTPSLYVINFDIHVMSVLVLACWHQEEE